MSGKKLVEGLVDVLDTLNDPFDESGERATRKGSKERQLVVRFLLAEANLSNDPGYAEALRAAARRITAGEHVR